MIAVTFRRLVSVILLLGILAPASSEAQLPLAQPDLDLRAASPGQAILALPDGGAIVSHNGDFVGGEPGHPFLFRLRPDGTIDPDWNVSASRVSAMALVDDDLYLAGSFSTVNGVSRRGLASVSLATGAVSDWDPNSGSTSADFIQLEVVGNSVYVAGGFSQIGTAARTGLAKIDRITGVVDEAFNPVVKGPFRPIRTMRSDGSALFIGGRFTEVNGGPHRFAAKLSLVDGSVNPNWNPQFNSSVEAMDIDGGWLYAVGCFRQVGGISRGYVARVATAGAGALDATWDPRANGGCMTYVHVDDNYAYISGRVFTQLGGGDTSRIGRVAKTGTGMLDSAWDLSLDFYSFSTLTLQGGAVLVKGSFKNVNDAYHPGVVRVDGNNGAVLGPEFYIESSGRVEELVAAPDGGVYVGGDFHRLAGTDVMRQGLLRLTPSGELDTSWDVALTDVGEVNALAADANHLYIGGWFTTSGTSALSHLVRVSHNGVVDSSWTPDPSSSVLTMALDETNNSLFVGGWFSRMGSESRSRLAEVDLAAGKVTAFNPQPNNTVEALILDGNDVYVGGIFTQIGGEARQRLAKLSRSGVVDPSFVADADQGVKALLLGPGNTLYVGGFFNNISGLAGLGLVRLFRNTGARDPAWVTFPNSAVLGLDVASDGFYVGGDFSQIGGVARSRVARVSHQGEVAPLFAPGGVSLSRIEAALEQGSKVTLGGSVNAFDTTPGLRRGLAAFPLNAAPVGAGERDALIALYNATDGDNWANNTGWLGAEGTECSWFGVTCANGSVTGISLNANGLAGVIPAELSQLTDLQLLRLDSNQLSGPIPAELSQLTDLQLLRLGRNQLSGPIPVELSQLTNLRELRLVGNQLSGPVPAELSQLANLEFLDLQSNELSGPIPAELSQLTNLRRLWLSNNPLSGPIPPELAELDNLGSLNLNRLQLTGTIPVELSQLTNLRLLYLFGNQLTGPIPAELSQLTNLQRLWLEDNQLTGPIPAELSQLTNLQWLWLSNNQLGGPIPPELGELTNATQIDLERNNLSGPVPMELGNLDTNLEFLGLAQNPSLTGTIPQSLLDRQAQGLLTITFDGTSVIGCEAQRVLPEGYIPGLPLTVTIQTQPETGTGSYAIEDQPPSSWAVSNVQGGVFDSGTGTVKFGPYFDANSRTLQYDLTPPANASGTGVFSGTYSKDGVSTGLCGPSTLEPSRSDLVVSKVASVATAAPGEQFSYTLTVSNNGPNTAQGVVLTDTLPGDLALLSASADCTGLSVVECSVGDLTPGAVASFTLEVEVSDTAPAGAIDNTVSVSAITPDPNPSNDTSTATVEIEKLSALNLVINQIDASSCPDMSALVTVTDQFGQSLGGLTGSNFTLAEDGQSLPFSLSTVSTGSSSRLAVSIVIDRSTSLSNADLMN
ncbi:DUF11 domain-containing protein, partial [Wenzhouxiangella sp. C33]|nr:DUF11 domain-containing protein [Wenzhouxiangella limi]